MTYFQDIADLEEDKRIDLIGHHVTKHKMTCAVVVDKEGKDGWEKADRYMRKLKAKFPGIKEITRFEGPVEGSVSVKVGPVDATQN